MENSNVNIKDKFRNGCVFIFKTWSGFRMTLDKNPQILTFYNEDHTTIEINEMLDTLYDEVFSIFSQFQGQSLRGEIADCLFGFIEDYFQVSLEDQSDNEIALKLIELYNDLMNGQDTLLNKLKVASTKVKKYEVDFPIEGNQQVIFELDDENEDDDEDNESENDEEDANNDEVEDDKRNEINDGVIVGKK